jgi:hypothetical protein
MYVLHSSMGSCGAPQLLVQLDDAISDAMGEGIGRLQAESVSLTMHVMLVLQSNT